MYLLSSQDAISRTILTDRFQIFGISRSDRFAPTSSHLSVHLHQRTSARGGVPCRSTKKSRHICDLSRAPSVRFGLAAWALLFTLCPVSNNALFAGSPAFPWNSGSKPIVSAGSAPVRALSPPAQAPIEVYPTKQAYPYGWFGSNPSYHWKRSFGTGKNYTQWSRY